MTHEAGSIPSDLPARNSGGSEGTGTAGAAPFVQPVRAYRSRGAWVRFLVPAVLGLAADLALKAWSFPDGVPAHPGVGAGRSPAGFEQPEVIIPGILRFTTTVNHGAVFGIGQGYVLVFLAFSFVALGIILWIFLTSFRRQWTVHLALGLITAGALGNLWDRAVYQGVRDMLQFYASWYQYIFNLADVLLCIGVPMLMVRWIFVKDDPLTKPGFPVEPANQAPQKS